MPYAKPDKKFYWVREIKTAERKIKNVMRKFIGKTQYIPLALLPIVSVEYIINVMNNREMSFTYDLDYNNFLLSDANDNGDSGDENDQEERQAIQGFNLRLPNVNKSAIGPAVFNNLLLYIGQRGKDIPYQTLKYALTNCPHHRMFQLKCMDTRQKICLSPADIEYPVDLEPCDPSLTTRENIKKIKLEGGVCLSNDIINLLSTYVPDVEIIVCGIGDFYRPALMSQTKLVNNIVLDLTSLGSVKKLSLDIRQLTHGKRVDHLFIRFKYASCCEEEFYYDIHQAEKVDKKSKFYHT